ncbi:MAG: hypothetical protein QNK23_01355 [Crocinitomicaceae bacterium]|nr:hypothetical protein [Crocinitomicaceae bacterium]
MIKNCIDNDISSERELVIDHLNNHILSIGTLSWDIGLNDSNHWFLTVSPNGDKDLYKISQEIMSFAPEHMDWVFNASKPAQNWNRFFNINDQSLDPQFVDASSWNYVAFEGEDGKAELIFEAVNIDHLDEETSGEAASYFVVAELGEAAKINLISSITIVQQLNDEDQSDKYSVSELRDHLLS